MMEIADLLLKARNEKRGSLLYPEAKELLDACGIPTAPSKIARSREEALQSALSIGYPVVMKILSADLTHKSDVGGVFTGLSRPEEVIAAYERIEENSRIANPTIRMDGVIVEKTLSGVEAIIGVTRDAQFGPVLMFGMGGIFVDLLKDISFRLIPIEPADALEMIHELRGFPLLEGYRGQKGDIESLASLLLKVSHLIVQYPDIALMDLNPVFVSSSGSIAGDVRIQLRNSPSRNTGS
jgi:acetate---CoA ligase (ADP-forming) subunit beta